MVFKTVVIEMPGKMQPIVVGEYGEAQLIAVKMLDKMQPIVVQLFCETQ